MLICPIVCDCLTLVVRAEPAVQLAIPEKGKNPKRQANQCSAAIKIAISGSQKREMSLPWAPSQSHSVERTIFSSHSQSLRPIE